MCKVSKDGSHLLNNFKGYIFVNFVQFYQSLMNYWKEMNTNKRTNSGGLNDFNKQKL